jgi:RNA methyltransferase, TrmH family
MPPTPITSPHNPGLKALRRLQTKRGREVSGRFSAEGEDLIAAAALAGWPAIEGYRLAGSALGGAEFADVNEDVLAAVSTLGSGTRAIGVYAQRWLQAPSGPLCVYLHGVADPGNVGTVLRGAHAFGASCVALGPGCADPYGPKAVRASMGAVFAVPLARAHDVAELPGERVALVAHAGEPLSALAAGLAGSSAAGSTVVGSSVTGSGAAVTLLVGAEREGLPDELVRACEHVACIPIASESLNAAMAATVALYEMGRVGTRSSRVRAS